MLFIKERQAWCKKDAIFIKWKVKKPTIFFAIFPILVSQNRHAAGTHDTISFMNMGKNN